MNKHPIAVSANGMEVYTNLVASAAGKQISAQPHLATLAQEVLASKNLSGTDVVLEAHMGRIVGTSDVVKTTDKDAVFYAKPTGSNEFMRFVKNRSYIPTHYLTLVLKEGESGYELLDINIGRKRPYIPGSPLASDTSEAFWAEHARIWENRSAQLQTITKDCPWPQTASSTAA